MAKRIATNELNDRNWDQEEDEEEAGKFVAANNDILQQRTIIKAKRRSQNTSTSSGTGLFSSFAGFGSASQSGNSTTVGFSALPSKPFLFGAGSSSSTTTSTSVSTTDSKSAEMQSTASALSTTTSSSSSSSNNGIKSTTTTTTTGTNKNSENQDSAFLSHLKKLNESVLKWIEQHVADNPFCILTPIFKDYDDHLNKIRKSKSDGSNVENSELSTTESNLHKNGSSLTTPSSTDTTTVTTSADSSITNPASQTTTTNSAALSTNTSTASPWTISSVPNSIFSSSNTTKTPLAGTQPSSIFGGTGFSFKPSDTKSAFSFDTSAAKNAPAAEEEEEYEPPKPEMKEIKEEGAVYTKRCKLFYEKDKNWIDKGVGNLHVKPLKDKAQLIIRADTNLGNILLNIMLLPSMQLKRQGKNNVSLVCIPNPPVSKDSDNKLIPMLLRVKTAEEADELLEELNKHKCGTESDAAE